MSLPIGSHQSSSDSISSTPAAKTTAKKQLGGKKVEKKLPPQKRALQELVSDVASAGLSEELLEPPTKKSRSTPQFTPPVVKSLENAKYSPGEIETITDIANKALQSGKLITPLHFTNQNQAKRCIILSGTSPNQEPQLVSQKIGSGSVKTAFKVISLLSGEPTVFAAVKSTSSDSESHYKKSIETIQHEYEIAKKYTDVPFILKIHSVVNTTNPADSTTSKGNIVGYFAEYCNQGDLFGEISTTPMPPERFKQVALQIGVALFAMHSRGDVHLDIKPENVFLKGDTKDVRLADFGLTTSTTKTTRLCGTILCIDPSFVRVAGQGQAIQPHTAYDIFSFGMTLYEMKYGISPYLKYFPESAMGHAAAEYKKRNYEPLYTLFTTFSTELAKSTDPIDKLIVSMIDQTDINTRPNALQVWAYLSSLQTPYPQAS